MKSFYVGICAWKFRGCGKRAEAEIPVVEVEAIERETIILVGGFQQGGVLECVAEAECAVMKEIVAEEDVAHASLFGHRFYRGMRVDHAHGDQKTVVGNTVQADPAVIVRNIFNQPIDGVVGVGAFIHAFRVGGIVDGPQHDEFSFGGVAAANVLEHEDITVGHHRIVARQHPTVAVVRTGDSIGSAFEENGKWLGGVPGRVDFGVKADAIAHRDHNFGLIEGGGVVGGELLRWCGPQRKKQYRNRKKEHTAGEVLHFTILPPYCAMRPVWIPSLRSKVAPTVPTTQSCLLSPRRWRRR